MPTKICRRVFLWALLLSSLTVVAGTRALASSNEADVARRCLRERELAAPGDPGRKAAFRAQTCLINTTLDESGQLTVTLRSQASSGQVPDLLLSAAESGAGQALPVQTEEDKSPIDVALVLMAARPTGMPESTEALRAGVQELVRAVYALPESRVGLIGYAHSKAEFSPMLPAQGNALLPASRHPEVQAKLDNLSVNEGQETRWALSSAFARALGLLEEAARTAPHHRRALIVYSHGTAEDGSDQMVDLLAYQLRSLQVQLALVPLLGHSKPPSKFLQSLADRAGGIIHRPSLTAGALQEQFADVRNGLFKRQRAQITLSPEQRSTGNLRLTWARSDGAPANLAESVLVVVPAPIAASPRATAPTGETLVTGSGQGVHGSPAARPLPREFIVLFLLAGLTLLALLLVARRISHRDTANMVKGNASLLPTSHSVWLHWVERSLDIPIRSLPHVIGNDLDCDTVTQDVGTAKSRVLLTTDAGSNALLAKAIDPDSLRDTERMQRNSLELRDGVEFLVHGQRFKLFVTPLNMMTSGVE